MDRSFSITLVICTYNNASLLRRTLNAMTQLEAPAWLTWQVLVVNNNSTDETEELVTDLIQKNVLPLQLVHEQQQGLTAARVCGVRQSSSEWVAFIDDDCLLSVTWLSEAVSFIQTHPRCVLFGSKIHLLWQQPPPAYVHQFPFAYAGKNHGTAAKQLASVAGAGMVAKRSALQACGWLHTQHLADRMGKKLVSGGDVEIALRAGTVGEVWYNPACQLQHIIPPHRTTKSYLQKMVFGLGASRHHVGALQWKGSYATWLPFSALYGIGMLALGLRHWIATPARAAGGSVALASFSGWCAGIASLWRMNKLQRKKLMGAAVKRAPVVTITQPANNLINAIIEP